MEDFKQIKDKAWSLPPGESRGQLIFVETTENDTYRYYYDSTDESYWYQSDKTEKFHQNLKKREKERKKCLRN